MKPAATGTKRLVLATTDVVAFTSLRAPLIEEIIRRRHKVSVFAPSAPPTAVDTLERLGSSVVITPFVAGGFNPIGAYKVKRDLTGYLKAFGPHTVAASDAGAILALSGLAKRAEVPRVVAMLPRLSLETGPVTASRKAMRQALANVTAVIVETPEDRRALLSADWFDEPTPIFTAPTSGINAQVHGVVPLPPLNDGFIFALVSHPDDTAARDIFNAAAAQLATRTPQARFVVADASNIQAVINASHAVVHASAIEGLCQGLLRALAAGRPVITTDVAASRDTVDERVNGCRVAPGDVRGLADAMASVLKRTDLVPAMARASRLKAERRYDLTEVNRITLEALGLGDDFAVAA
jgi:glycosyltransferase involved in cell wall biosynthesis